jgi:hypothetical protein
MGRCKLQRLFILLYFYAMKHTVYTLFAFGLLILACKNNSAHDKPILTDSTISKDSPSLKQDFFPVPDYIGGQLKMIDSFKLPLSATVIINNTTQMHAASSEELMGWAKKFQEPDIGTDALKKQYKETSIADQSGPSVILSYTTDNTALPVQKIDVYLKPDPVNSDKVTGIYIEKTYTLNDTVFNQKLYWKTDKNLQVVTEKKINGVTLPVEQTKITWNF